MKKHIPTNLNQLIGVIREHVKYLPQTTEPRTMLKREHEYGKLTPIKITERIKKLGEGSGGKVIHVKTAGGSDYASKIVEFINNEITFDTVREIAILRLLKGSNDIIQLKRFQFDLVTKETTIYIDYADISLYDLIHDGGIKHNELNNYFNNIVLAVNICHNHDIVHCDIKTSNIVLRNNKLVLIDFGISECYFSYFKQHSTRVQTLMYRAPEVLLGDTFYTNKIDIWSIGCVFFEMITGEYLVSMDKYTRRITPEEYYIDGLFRLFGSPRRDYWPEAVKLPLWDDIYGSYSNTTLEYVDVLGEYFDIIMSCLTLDPVDRPSTVELLDIIH